ncbi:hypothetical protein HanRHA438_Chr11g0487631 [Helianthus annuus]|nr:hypothetical protein HanIR_Chr11g0510981 [Helianthus annuus]KAJ0869299.1 hypothetical protein HanRHA438_Chr11g0487631 [Helianthus annuus]
MARLIDLGGNIGDEILESNGSHIVFMLCMILVSMSIISMVIFVCGDNPAADKPTPEGQSSKKDQGGGGCGGGGGGGGGGGCGCCGDGGGDGGDGGGGCGGCGGCGG